MVHARKKIQSLNCQNRFTLNSGAVPLLLPHLPNQSSFEIESDVQNTSLPPSSVWSRRQDNSKRAAERHTRNGKVQRTFREKTGEKFTTPMSPRKEEPPKFNGNNDKSSRTVNTSRFPQIAVSKAKEKKTKSKSKSNNSEKLYKRN